MLRLTITLLHILWGKTKDRGEKKNQQPFKTDDLYQKQTEFHYILDLKNSHQIIKMFESKRFTI